MPTVKDFTGAAKPTTLSVSIDAVALSLTCTSFVGWPTGANGPFNVILDRDTANEEKVLATGISGTTLTLSQRGYDGTTARSHSATAVVEHGWFGVDAAASNAHINATASVHGLPAGDAFVGSTALANAIANSNAAVANAMPVGAIIAYGAAVPPANWLLCDGSAVSTSYPALRAIMTTTPDLRNAFIMGGTPAPASRVGADTATLTGANLPNHTHSVSSISAGTPTINAVGGHSHTGATTGGGAPDHNHLAGSATDPYPGFGPRSLLGTAGANVQFIANGVASAGAHTHTTGASDRSLSHDHVISPDGGHTPTAQALAPHAHVVDGGGQATPTAISLVSTHVVLAYLIRAA
jgi:microcystin-dependent protein